MAITRALDPTYPINDASSYVHVQTDTFTVHDYDQNPQTFRDRCAGVLPELPGSAFVRLSEFSAPYQGQPYLVDEYNWTFWTKDYVNHPKKAGQRQTNWGYGKLEKQVEDRIKTLTEILLNHPYIAGFTCNN